MVSDYGFDLMNLLNRERKYNIQIIKNYNAFISESERKNQKQSTDSSDNKTDETKVITKSNTEKGEQGTDAENANG